MEFASTQDFEAKTIHQAILQAGIRTERVRVVDEFRGGQCHVFKLKLDDSDRGLALRVPLYMTPDAMIDALRAELQNYQKLEAKSFAWSPRCLAHSLTFDNPIKHPFIVLTWIVGSHLVWTESSPPPPTRHYVLAQMAKIQLNLIECTLEDSPFSASEFFQRLSRNRMAGVEASRFPRLTLQDCLDQQALLPTILGTDSNDIAVAMDHGDFKPDNIIVDDKYNIKGVIDWAFAASVPLPRAAGLPRFLWLPSPLSNVSSIMRQDRSTYIFSLSDASSPVVAWMRRWQTGKEVDMRTLYLESLFSKGMHLTMAQAKWTLVKDGEKENGFD